MKKQLIGTISILVYLSLKQVQAQNSTQDDKLVIINLESKNKVLNKKIQIYKGKVKKLSIQNIQLRKVAFSLKRDSLFLATSLAESISENKRITLYYQTQVDVFGRELSVVRDSLVSMNEFKGELTNLKSVLSTVSLAFRTYDFPVEIAISQIKTFFVVSSSSYMLDKSSDKILFVDENPQPKASRMQLVGRKKKIKSSYVLSFRPHPIDNNRTLMDIRVLLKQNNQVLFSPEESMRYKEQIAEEIDHYLETASVSFSQN